MKEKLYTIPLNDAFRAEDECPFCFIERSIEQDLLDFILGSGSSYMESDIRGATDNAGFCRFHFHKMFEYGNTLGNGWILKTHYEQVQKEMKAKFKSFQPAKSSFANRFKKTTECRNSISAWVEEKEKSCYICRQYQEDYERYLDTFFILYKKDASFRELLKNSKGFCLQHFGALCEGAETQLNDSQKAEFFPLVFQLMEENLNRIHEDVSWLVDKFDYRNQDADWKNSKDAIQRGMQKLKGGYPADPAYRQNK